MKNLLFIFIFLISGCVGDRLDFRNPGAIYKKNNSSFCINSKEGDTLTYYLLTSSEDNYKDALVFEDHIENKYPNHCFNIIWKEDITYNLLYEMNDIKYRVNFKIDNGQIKQGVNNI